MGLALPDRAELEEGLPRRLGDQLVGVAGPDRIERRLGGIALHPPRLVQHVEYAHRHECLLGLGGGGDLASHNATTVASSSTQVWASSPSAMPLPVDRRSKYFTREEFIRELLPNQADPTLWDELADLLGTETTDDLEF